MQGHFPLFFSHLECAHRYWQELLSPGDWVIDATCGNGHDTLALAQCVLDTGRVLAMDVQERALDQARSLISQHFNPEQLSQVHFFLQSHENFPEMASQNPIRLIVYNLGYLPGSDKQIKTLPPSTLASLKKGLDLIAPGGAISITCYPGHPEGREEQQALLQFCRELDRRDLQICHQEWLRAPSSPSLLLIQKSFSH
jgi:SAM-dependent methyltransferase